MRVEPRDEDLSRADAAWLHADVPTNHFVVTSLALLDEPIDAGRLQRMLTMRLGLYPRLRQVVSDPLLPLAAPRWTAARDFDLGAHIHRVALPAPGDAAELAAFIGDLVGHPLDFGRPLWDLYAIEGPGAGGALVGRFHHALGDGQAMVRLLLALTDRSPNGWKRPVRAPVPARPASLGDALGEGLALLGRLPDLAALAPRGLDAAGTLARLTLMDGDRQTSLRGPLSLVKKVSWSEPLPLTGVKAVAHASGTTVNDVIVSALAGAIGTHLRSSGADIAGLKIRAMLPVNLRDGDDRAMTGNRFSLVYLPLPVGVTHPWERLMRVKIEMERIKASTEPAVGWLLVQSLGLLPRRLEHVTAGFYADKASLVLTNVVGPDHPIYMAGVRIRDMTFWEPESGGLGVGISIFSYDGRVMIGIISDANLVPVPEDVTRAFGEAFADLERVALASAGSPLGEGAGR